MRKMLQQAQKMQAGLAKVQEELEEARVEGTAGGGMVRAVVNGRAEMVSISIDSEAVDPEDVEMLEDLVMAAVRDAAEKSRKLSESKMKELGVPMGGLGGMM
jgi:hypothetical protein